MSHMVLASGMAAETQTLTFWILAVVAVAAMVLAPRAVHCAVLLAGVMLSLAMLYALQGAPFLAVQVIVYTGAVLMLFLFVLMIVGVNSRDSIVDDQGTATRRRRFGRHRAARPARPDHRARGDRPGVVGGANYSAANVHGLARLIFTTYVYPFESHQRPADHRRAGRHGAGAPRAHHAQADPAGAGPAPADRRAPGAAARPGHLRAAQRSGHARPAARRLAVRAVGQPGDRLGRTPGSASSAPPRRRIPQAPGGTLPPDSDRGELPGGDGEHEGARW